jgi:hypothetical protein
MAVPPIAATAAVAAVANKASFRDMASLRLVA